MMVAKKLQKVAKKLQKNAEKPKIIKSPLTATLSGLLC
jgi:hypothetical protein